MTPWLSSSARATPTPRVGSTRWVVALAGGLVASGVAGCAAQRGTRSDRSDVARVAAPTTPAPSAVLRDGAVRYGRALDPDAPRVALRELVLDVSQHAGRVVTTEGTVVEVVCRGMGCWLRLAATPTAEAVVALVAEPFFVPRDLRGRHVVAQGQVSRAAGADAAVRVAATGIEVR